MSSDEDEYSHEKTYSDLPKPRFRCFKQRKVNHPVYLVYPDDQFVGIWDIYIAVVLVFSCMTVPYRLALINEDTLNWMYINGFIDICFLLDIIVIFNKTIFDENYLLVTNRKIIGNQYMKGWFFIDLVAIIPFDLVFGGSELNQVVRIARIGRMYKLVKLTRLIRVLKIVKDKSKFLKYMEQLFKIGMGLQRFLGFILAFFILIHLSACLWIMTATMMGVDGVEGTWMEGDIELMQPSE